MSINKLISIKTPIVDAMEMCGLENNKDQMVFTRWAYQAEKEIGSRYQFIKKIAVLDIEGCAACLPQDAAYMQRALLGDFGCDCTDLFYRWCATTSSEGVFESPVGPTFLVVDAGSGESFSSSIPLNCEIQDNKIVLMSSAYSGQKLTVQYLGYKTDCDGFLEVSENHVLAIRNYLCMNYFLRKRRKSNDDFFSVNLYEREWHREVGNARAQDSVLTEGQRANIVSILHDPYIGIGIPTGYTTMYGGL